MREFFKKWRETFIEKRKEHIEFREDYADKQNKRVTWLCVVLLCYASLGFLFVNSKYLEAVPSARISYLFLFAVSIVGIGLCLLGLIKDLFKTSVKRNAYYEGIVFIITLSYIAWGIEVMSFSIIEGRETNYMPMLIVYIICTIFMYFPVHMYVLLFISGAAGAFISVNVFKPEGYDRHIVLNLFLCGLVLTFGAISKYFIASKEFRQYLESHRLKEELIANNEELIATNEELSATTERLKESMEKERLYTASINHELRSPLNGVIGMLQIIRDDGGLSEENTENLNTAIASSATLLQIVNDLLDYAKLQAGGFTVVQRDFDLHTIMDVVRSMSESFAERKGLEFYMDTDPNMPCRLKGDCVRIQQIIVNIVSNGIKYTEKGFVKVKTTMDDSDRLCVEVTDSGRGMSEESKADLFRPFKRIDEEKNAKIEGTGLGLYIVKDLLDCLEGEIDVESKPGEGSVFTIRIPVTVTDTNVLYGDVKASVKTENLIALDLSGKRILCVDDNKVNLAVFKGMFKGTEASVVTHLSASEALEDLRLHRYDLIFLDHLMPEMDGIELYEKMRSRNTPNSLTPVVMLTGNAALSENDEYKSKGLAGFIMKPVIKEELMSAIADII